MSEVIYVPNNPGMAHQPSRYILNRLSPFFKEQGSARTFSRHGGRSRFMCLGGSMCPGTVKPESNDHTVRALPMCSDRELLRMLS